MLKIKILILFIFLLIVQNNLAFATDSSTIVRVGISNSNFQTYLFDKTEFDNASALTVIDAQTGYSAPVSYNSKKIKITSENNLFRIFIDDTLVAKNLTGPILISSKDESGIQLSGLKRKGIQAAYHGYIELVRNSKNNQMFSIVNVLNLKDYLKGVVPNEMPVKFGLEALKAQTIAARNYAITPRLKAFKEFDLCDSVACQVYFGANTENPLSNQAIEETNGIIAIDNKDEPILALYSSTAGGYTGSYEFAFSNPETKQFPSKHIHYLIETPDSKDFKHLDKEEVAAEFFKSSPESFDNQSPYYRWTKEISNSELENVLAKTLVAQSKTGFVSPQLLNESDFGKLLDIKVKERSKSGKIVKIDILTENQNYSVSKELVIRRCFQINGISLPSANFVVEKSRDENPKYTFYGAGFGHGVGLSQWGAGKMASLGYSYDEILQHYYNGIQLTTMPVKIYPNEKRTIDFFKQNKMKCELIINRIKKIEDNEFEQITEQEEQEFENDFQNPENETKNICRFEEIKITINNRVLIEKLNRNKTVINITKYLNKGGNKITYELINCEKDCDNYVEARIKVKEADNG